MHSLAPSPVNVNKLEKELMNYTDPVAAAFLLNGFRTGFSLNYDGPHVLSESKNIKSALEHTDIVGLIKALKRIY